MTKDKRNYQTCSSPWVKCIYGRLAFLCLAAAAIRYWLIFFSKYQSLIADHIEVSTPLNAWKRVKEGLYLFSIGINPYYGDMLHETPTSLFFYQFITESLGLSTGHIFIIFDIITATFLFLVTRQYMFMVYIEREENKSSYSKNIEEYLYTNENFRRAPLYVAATFLFNPYTILNCVGFTTTVFFNFFLSVFLYLLLSRKFFLCSLFLAFCTSMSFYSIILVVPMCLHAYKQFNGNFRAIFSMISFLVNFLVIMFIGHLLDKTDSFLENVYGFIITVPDLKPNIGLFWYFFTEMFDHFRELFIYSFQINATILYLIPLALKFHNDVFLLITALLYISTIFKSYPCVGDVGLVLSLLPCYKHLFNYSQQQFLILVIYIISFCLGPIVWHLWIYSNSANANFYFGVTLAFAVAQIFLVTDILFVHIKREFCLYFGKKSRIGGKEAILVLE
ncbi:hypothetical protein WA026_002363 [Henosepilachna vigintioctopunctata]|uniref:Phosphatidylinositol glycan anchor biosynthesis class U protein n=1 Tax=Henosepilachna vigintioctopunctata TaxID=420089 RepID=A0AAW1U1I7_9CUCU